VCGKIANPAPWIGTLVSIVLAIMPRGKAVGGAGPHRARIGLKTALRASWPGSGSRAKPADLLAGRRVADRVGEEHAASVGRPGYWSWLLVVLVVVAVAFRRLNPSFSVTTSTVDRALPSSAVQLRCWSQPMTTTQLPLLTNPRLVGTA
jgi:hypothetical protein